MVPVSGSGHYLQSTRRTDSFVEGAVLLETTTEQITLNLHNLHGSRSVSIDAFRNRDATHVVVGVTFGARVILSARLSSRGDSNHAREELKSKLDELASYVRRKQMGHEHESSGYYSHDCPLHKSLADLTFAIFSDFRDWQRVMNIGIREVTGFIDDFPTLLDTSNAGLGVDISYTLENVGILQYLFGISIG